MVRALAQIATAMPRRRTNHSEVSATSGANVVELPSAPSSIPCASAKAVRLPAMPAAMKPAPSPTAPIIATTITPQRSAILPIATPPSPKPTIISVYGSDASARATPNSACTGGSTTAITYIAPLPIVIISSTANRRIQA